MGHFPNVMVFKQAKLSQSAMVFNTNGSNFAAWLQASAASLTLNDFNTWLTYSVSGYTRNPSTADFHAPAGCPVDYRIAMLYHYFIKLNAIVHIAGLDYFNHFIKKPISWSIEVHHTEPIYDEEGLQIGETEILNKDYYVRQYTENATDCLVKMIDKDYVDMELLVTYDINTVPTNMYCEADYFISKTEAGKPVNEVPDEVGTGEFYIAPVVEPV